MAPKIIGYLVRRICWHILTQPNICWVWPKGKQKSKWNYQVFHLKKTSRLHLNKNHLKTVSYLSIVWEGSSKQCSCCSGVTPGQVFTSITCTQQGWGPSGFEGLSNSRNQTWILYDWHELQTFKGCPSDTICQDLSSQICYCHSWIMFDSTHKKISLFLSCF